MKIFDAIGFSSKLTGSFSGSFVGDGSSLIGTVSSSIATTASYIELSNVDGSASLANSASFASDISANSASIGSLNSVSGSYANSASFASDISVNSASIASLETVSGSYANSSSFASDISTNSASIGSLNAVSSSYLLNTTDTLTGDLTVTGNIIATTLNVQDVTASVVYSSGSNVFGSSSIDTQQFTGSILTSGSIEVNGDKFTVSGATGNTVVGGTLNSDNITVGKSDGNNSSISLTANTGNWTFTNVQSSRNLEISDSDGTGTVMTIDTSGNVGIGTDSPVSLLSLEVSSASTTTGISTPLGISLQNTNTTDGNFTSIQNRDGNGDQNAEIKFFNISHANNQGAIAFTTRSSTGEFGEKMRIDSSGNVGIAWSSPSDFTSVNADNLVVGSGTGSNGITVFSATNAYGQLAFADGTGTNDQYKGLIQYAHPDDSMRLFTANAERMRIDSAGNVGIGTTNPAQNFVVADATNGNGVELVPGATATIQTYNRGTSSYNNLNIDTARTQIRSIDYTSFHNGSGFTERMRIDSSGIVSITNESSDGLIIERTGTTTGKYRFGIGGTNLLTIRDVAQSQTRMAIDSSGNVGINQTNPTSGKLEVQQTATTAALWVQTGGTTSSYTIADFRTGTNASALNIKGDGVVGIGTDFVSARLQVHSTNAGQPTIPLFIVNESTTIGTEARLGFAANTNNDVGTNRYSYISTINTSGSNGQAMIFATNETGASAVERMRITSGGNVGINKTDPAYKLHARGGSGTEETVLKIDKSSAADSGGHTTIVGLGCETAGWAKAGIAFERTGAYDTGKMHFLMYPAGLNTNTVGLSNSVMTINNDGNVGIGTTSPTDGKVQIQTASAIGYTPTSFMVGANLRLTTGGTAAASITTGVSMGIGGAAEAYIGAVQNASNYADIVFQTYHAAYGERMKITSDGHLARNSKKVWNFTASKSFTEGGSSDNFFRLNFDTNTPVFANITLMSNNAATGSRTMQSVQAMLSVSYQGYLPTMTEITKTAVSNNGSSYISAVQGANGSLTFLCDTTNNTTGTSNTTFVSVELISNGAIDATITVL